MADEPANDQVNQDGPSQEIDKSSFPGGGMPMSTPASDKTDDPATDIQSDSDTDAAAVDLDDVISGQKPKTEEDSVSRAPSVATPEIADDNDLIEKEWVNKAKHIIDTTKMDPYTQSNELTLFKADYIKKRYNKTIKTGE